MRATDGRSHCRPRPNKPMKLTGAYGARSLSAIR
jgi:hypothetical protein